MTVLPYSPAFDVSRLGAELIDRKRVAGFRRLVVLSHNQATESAPEEASV
ncbi:hypothetical protein [Rhodopirellula sp. MGV]|nr:hypothetical protein [Rhodopirellula sp. MGV]